MDGEIFTVTHAKDRSSLLNDSLHLDAVLECRSHRLLAQNVIALLCEGTCNFKVHVVLHRDDDCVGETFPDRVDCLRGSCMQILPCREHKGFVYIVIFGKGLLCFWARFSDGDDLAAIWEFRYVTSIGLGDKS